MIVILCSSLNHATQSEVYTWALSISTCNLLDTPILDPTRDHFKQKLHYNKILSDTDGHQILRSRDGGAWWAAVYGVTQGRTRLKQLSSSSSRTYRLEPKRLILKSSAKTYFLNLRLMFFIFHFPYCIAAELDCSDHPTCHLFIHISSHLAGSWGYMARCVQWVRAGNDIFHLWAKI